MTLNLTAEQKQERLRTYRKEYAKAYYHLIKKEEPEKHKVRVEKERIKANARYAKKKEENNLPDKVQKKRNIKITLET
jgi:hypothetical protein